MERETVAALIESKEQLQEAQELLMTNPLHQTQLGALIYRRMEHAVALIESVLAKGG
jgi:hypothetical protein